MQIRKAKPEDVQEISEVAQEVVKGSLQESGDYNEFEIGEWLKRTSVEAVEEKIGVREVFVGIVGGKIVSTIAFYNGKVLGFYVKKDLQGKGMGGKMLRFIEEYAFEKGLSKIELTSTPIAEEFYLKRGYKNLGKVQVKLGEAIMEETKMVKEL